MNQKQTNIGEPPQIDFQTKKQFLQENPAFTAGGLDWLIFHKKKCLQEAGAIAYFGSRVFINTPVLNKYVLGGGANVISGVPHEQESNYIPPIKNPGLVNDAN